MIKNILNKSKIILYGLLVIVILAVVYVLTYNIIEPRAYDLMTKNFLIKTLPFDSTKQVYGSDNIVLIVVDEKTVDKYRWPWKRERYCKLFNFLNEYSKPRAIVYDMLIAADDLENPQSDKVFYDCIRELPNLIVGFAPSYYTWENETFGKYYETEFAHRYGLSLDDKSSEGDIAYQSMITFPKNYMNSVKNTGSVLLPIGGLNRNISGWVDEISRTQEPFIKINDNYYPSLAMKTYLFLNKNSKIILSDKSVEIKFEDKNFVIKLLNKNHGFYKLKKYCLKTFSIPVKYYHLHAEGYSHKKYSAVDVISSYESLKAGKSPVINPDIFKDKIVVIGANVPAGAGLNDNKNSSIVANHPGVDIQATAIDNLVNNDLLKLIPQWINLVITILGMLLVFGFIRIFDLVKSIISTVLIISLYILASACCFYNGVVINVITPVFMFVVTTIFAYTDKFVIENKSKEKVKAAMGKYMSEDVMQNVVKNIDNLGLGGKRAVVTVLFADIRGFTSISEKMSAQQVSELLNEYFTEMEPIISGYNGIINKFIGDAIMAIFGEPIQDGNHARNAVICAYKMLEHVQQLHKKWKKEGKPQIDIGIGINTGEVFVGNIGSVNRMEYTVIGDTVNLASRLESYNKMYRTKILISSSTYNHVKDFADVLKISDVRIRGKANKIDIYEVLKVNMDKI